MVAGRKIKALEKMTIKGRMVQRDEKEHNTNISLLLRIIFID